ncbi:hypothetical protein B566_EDAN002841, partial [Ephemera danica]
MALILITAVIVLLTCLWLIIRRPAHPADQLPGPPTVPFFGNALMFAKPSIEGFEAIQENARKYWPFYRIWISKYLPIINPLGPTQVETILNSTEHITKSYDYDILSDWLGQGLITSTGAKWHSRRKLLTPTFHFNILEQFVPVFCDKTRILVEKLKSAALENPGGVDVVPYVTMCTFDIICQTAMGCSLDIQEGKNATYVSAVTEITGLMYHRVKRPWLFPNWTFFLTRAGKEYQSCLKTLHDFTDTIIRKRRRKKKIAFLDLLLKCSDEDPTFDDKEIRAEVDTFMFASRCVEELDDIFCGSDRDPNITDLGNMKYLERVIKETLRIRPSMDMMHFPPRLSYTVHRNPEIYPDPEKFDPDRFLPENCVGRHPYAYIPFSAGPRNCIGQRFAMLEVKEVISTVLRHFRLESCNPELNGEPCPDFILRPFNGMDAVLIAITVTLATFLWLLIRRSPHPVDQLPGPPTVPFFGNALMFVKPPLGANWHSRRKLLTPAFHFSILEQFVPVFCDKTRILIDKLQSAATNSPDGFDIVPYVTRCTLDMICGKKRRVAFLDLLLTTSEKDPSLTDKEIRAEVDTFMFEEIFNGSTDRDPNITDLGNMKYLERVIKESLRLRPPVRFIGRKVHTNIKFELEEIFNGSTDRDPNITDMGNMKYLERVIKESLRLRPPVRFVGRKVHTNIKFDGYYAFPPNTVIHVNIYNSHRNPEIYPDPEKFDPDRFLPENCVGRHPYAYIPFSAGPRNCIGQRFAMLEMKEVISTVLRHLRLESCDPEFYGVPCPNLILKPMNGLRT